MKPRIFFLLLVCVSIISVELPSFAKNRNIPLMLSTSEAGLSDRLLANDSSNIQLSKRFSFGWGVSYVVGDITNDVIGLQLSTLVSYRFTPIFEVSFATHFVQSSFSDETTYYVNTAAPSRIIPTNFNQQGAAFSVSSEITGTLIPFAEAESDFKRLRVGFGSVVRIAGMMRSSSSMNIITRNLEFSVIYTRQLAFGGTVSLEYLFPISNILEIGIRGQAIILAPPTYLLGEKVSLASFSSLPFDTIQSTSLGAFLRINF
jgi:hypothetical protein